MQTEPIYLNQDLLKKMDKKLSILPAQPGLNAFLNFH